MNHLSLVTKLLAVFLLIHSASHALWAQYPALEWTRIAKDTSLRWARQKDMVVDSAGNVLAVAFVSTGSSRVNLRVHKFSPSGSLQWIYNTPSFSFESDAEDISLRCDANNNAILCGQKDGRFFVTKLSPSGSKLWSVTAPNTPTSADAWETRAFALDSSGNVYVTGEVMIRYSSFHQVGVIKLSASSGAILWQTLHQNSGEKLRPAAIAVSSAGHLCVAASVRGPAVTADIRLVSLATGSGAVRWAATYNNTTFNQDDLPTTLAVDSSGNYIVGGASDNASNEDAFAAKYMGADGRRAWLWRFNNDADGNDWISKVLIDGGGNVFAVGSTRTPYVNGYLNQHDYLVAKLSGSDGSLLWRKQYQSPCPGDANDLAADACLSPTGQVIVTGGTSVGHSDAFTWSLSGADGSRAWQQRYTRPGYYCDIAGFRVAMAPTGHCLIGIQTDGQELMLVKCNPSRLEGSATEDGSAVQMVMSALPIDGLSATVWFRYEYRDPINARTVTGDSPAMTMAAGTQWQTFSYLLRQVTPLTQVRFRLMIRNGTGTYELPANSFPVVWTYSLPPPRITDVPDSVLAVAGGSATFAAQVSGGQPMQFQWLKEGASITGATSARYTVGNVRLADAGRYWLRATNLAGSATSAEASLVVVDARLASQSVEQGQDVRLAITVSGPSGATLSYQWHRNGVRLANGMQSGGTEVAGATHRELSILNLTEAWEGRYHCVVTMNRLNLATTTATISVVSPPLVNAVTLPAAGVSGALRWQLTATESPAAFTITGLPAGLNYDPKTGLILGVPNVSGSFKIRVSARNAAGASPVREFTLVIAPLPAGVTGAFSGLVARHNGVNAGLGGFLSLSISGSGTFTGSLKNGSATHILSGRLNAPPAASPTATVSLPRIGTAASSLHLTFAGGSQSASGTVAVGTDSAAASLRRHGLSGSATYAATYNIVNDVPAAALNNPAQPQGSGFQQIHVLTSGQASGTGRTPEGEAYTFAGTLGTDGSLPQFVLLPGGGSITALPRISTGATLADNRVTGYIEHSKRGPINASDRTYAVGIPVLRRSLDGSPWIPPTRNSPIVLRKPDQAANAQVAFAKGGMESARQFADADQVFRITTRNLAVFSAAPAVNPCAVSMSLTPVNGTFTGTLLLKDTVSGRVVSRTVNYRGLMLSHRGKGYGQFLLPGLSPSTSASPILSGKVTLN